MIIKRNKQNYSSDENFEIIENEGIDTEFENELENEEIELDLGYDNESTQETQEQIEIPEEVIEGASEVITLIFMSAAQMLPYWKQKETELIEKYGSISQFQNKLQNSVTVAMKGNRWLQYLLTKSEFVTSVLSLTPLIITLYELYSPPQIIQNEPKEEVIKEEVVKDEVKNDNNIISVKPGVYPID